MSTLGTRIGILSLCCFAVAILFIFLGMDVLLAPEPKPMGVIIDIPYEVVEVLPAEKVHTGTFKIVLSLNEWLERFQQKENPERPLVTYYGCPSGILVEYWLPRRDGTFFYSEDYKTISWPRFFTTGRIEQKANLLVAYPTKLTVLTPLFFIGALFFLICSICLICTFALRSPLLKTS